MTARALRCEHRHDDRFQNVEQMGGTEMNTDSDVESFELPATLDLAAASGLLDAIRSRLAAAPRLRIDASGVETLTVPCIQVLLAACRGYDGISIQSPSAALLSALDDVGLDRAELCGRSAPEPDQQPVAAAAGVGSEETAAAPDAPAAQPDRNRIADPALGVGPGESPEAPATVLDATGGAAQSPPKAENQAMARRILTIDDSKTIRDMLKLTLAGAGFDVVQAVDGQDGLDVLGRQQVDIVITDINMPRMDGFEVIRQMRSNESYNSVPILVLSTESEAQKKNIARVSGATGWLVKPFDPDKLIATINKVLPAAA